MRGLSELIAYYQCPNGVLESPPEWMAFAQFTQHGFHVQTSVATIKEWGAQASAVKSVKGWGTQEWSALVTVFGVVYKNDAFLGGLRVDEDGIQRVCFPGYGVRVTSSSLAEDWRYLVLAVAAGADTGKPAILEVLYGSAVVRAYVDAKTWEAVDELCSQAFTRDPAPYTPGVLCENCVRRHDCGPLQTHVSRYDLPGPEVRDKKQRAHRLWLLAIGLRAKMRADEALWKTVKANLKACVEEGRIAINEYFHLDARGGEKTSYAFEPTYDILKAHGLWKPEYGRIQVGELGKDIQGFPQKVRDSLDRLKQVDATEPVLREVVSNGNTSIHSTLFKCLSGGEQK